MAELFDIELEPFELDPNINNEYISPQEELDLYSCSLDSSNSYMDLNEISTPLLYESKIPSRNNSISSGPTNEDIDQFQLDLSNPQYVPKTIPELSQTTIPKTIIKSQTPESLNNNELSDIIKKGSLTLQKNYKRWLLTSITSF